MFETSVVEVQSDYEIERGKPMPSKHHSFVQSNLNFEVRAKYPGKFRIAPEISLDLPERERVPDLAIYEPMEYGEEEMRMTQVPLCVIEILSPSQSPTELILKKGEYFRSGVQSYWMVIPDLRSIYVYYSGSDFDVFAKNEVLKDKKLGIELGLQDIFS